MKTLWAVACAVIVGGMILWGLTGCASAPAKVENSAFPAGAVAPDNSIVPSLKYRIGPEDILHISVWENKELTLDVVVRPDGKISLPLVQDVQAEGLTADELGAQLKKGFLNFIKDPVVSVIITQINSSKFYIIGSVSRPGPYPLRGEISVLQALSLAGGFTQFASPRKIKIIRNNSGNTEIRKVNYYDILDSGEGNYFVKAGDTIVVP